MKYLHLLFFILTASLCFSQQKLPVIKATSEAATIFEAGQPLTSWTLSPQTKIDVYTTNKLTNPTLVKLKTDIDSIGFTIRPGQYKDLIVLLNGKDTCYTRLQAPAVKNFQRSVPAIHDTIPFIINNSSC